MHYVGLACLVEMTMVTTVTMKKNMMMMMTMMMMRDMSRQVPPEAVKPVHIKSHHSRLHVNSRVGGRFRCNRG